MLTELTLGGLIFHIVSVEPQIPDVMATPNVIMKFDNHNLLLGTNSVRKPIIGYGYDVPIVRHESGNLDFKIGGYLQDQKPFRDIGVKLPFHSFMPVLGFETDFPITDNVQLTTTITPLMSFTGITFRF